MNSAQPYRPDSLMESTKPSPEINSDDSCDSDLDAFLSESDDSSDNEDWVLRQAIKSGGKRKSLELEVDSDLEMKARTFVEERMTRALVRKCWKCRRRFIKTEGCNKMTCACGAVTCYFCRHAVRNDFDSLHVLCPAVTSTEDDSREVRAAGRRAKKKILKALPSLVFNIPSVQVLGND